jgi:hypothetical protein
MPNTTSSAAWSQRLRQQLDMYKILGARCAGPLELGRSWRCTDQEVSSSIYSIQLGVQEQK